MFLFMTQIHKLIIKLKAVSITKVLIVLFFLTSILKWLGFVYSKSLIKLSPAIEKFGGKIKCQFTLNYLCGEKTGN